jgi:hypothetical protein
VSRALFQLGRCALRRSAPAAAIASLEAALAINQGSISAVPPANTRWELARALTLSGKDSARAMELAKFAANGYRKAGGELVARATAIEAWLADGATRDSLPSF